MNVIHRESLAPGVTRLSTDASLPRPHLAICGGIHGNEPCGVAALRWLDGRLADAPTWVRAGTVLLANGNLRAIAQGRRHSEGGVDLNRIWDFRYQTRLVRDAWAYEHARALELAPVFEDVDAVLDLHSSTSASPPFAICNAAPGSAALAKHMSVPFVVEQWISLENRVLTGHLAQRSIPAVVVECGAHQAPSSLQVAQQVSQRFLAHWGLLQEPDETPASDTTRFVRIAATLTKPSERFRFSTPIEGFQKLSRGTIIGRDDFTELKLVHDCYAVLPNDQVAPGDDVLYLAVPSSTST